MYIIPTEIELMGRHVKIVYEAYLADRHGHEGEARYSRDEIAIQKDVEGCKTSHTQQVETFFHELMHWIFTMLGDVDLRNNEPLVERVGNLLAQAMLSAHGEGE